MLPTPPAPQCQSYMWPRWNRVFTSSSWGNSIIISEDSNNFLELESSSIVICKGVVPWPEVVRPKGLNFFWETHSHMFSETSHHRNIPFWAENTLFGRRGGREVRQKGLKNFTYPGQFLQSRAPFKLVIRGINKLNWSGWTILHSSGKQARMMLTRINNASESISWILKLSNWTQRSLEYTA